MTIFHFTQYGNLTQEYNVDIYFSGHDHIAEHLQYDGVDYFIAGGGALTGDEEQESVADKQWVGAGFSSIAVASVTKDNFTISYYNVNNEMIYQYTRVKVEEMITDLPSSQPTTTPTMDESNGNVEGSFNKYETALYTFYASCSALGMFAFAFLFSSAYTKVANAKSTQQSDIDLKSINKYFTDYDRDSKNYDEEEGGGMELRSYEVSSPAPNRHSPHMPNQPSTHPQATSKLSSPSPPDDIGVSRQSRYLSPKARQHYRHRDQGRLRSLGFTHIP